MMDATTRQFYRKAWQQRGQQAEETEQLRWQESMKCAQHMAERLRDRWGAHIVIVFGSVARRARGKARLSPISDIDIAVDGIDSHAYYTVLADIDNMSP